MAKRGRKSSTSVAVLPPVDPAEIESIARPEPPECLDVSARDVWLGVVENLPADWFEPVMFPFLEQYCRHVVEAWRLNALIVQAVEKHSFYSPMRLRQEPIAKNYPATPPGGRAGSPAPLRRSRRSTGPTEGEHQPAPRLQRQDDPLDRATTGNGSGLVVGRDVSCAGGLPRGLLPGSSTACGRQRDGVASSSLNPLPSETQIGG